MIKVAFLGTPSIGASALKSLLNNDEIEVVVVVTTEDKPVGRSHSTLQPSPVARLAEENKIDIIKTTSINKDIDLLKKYEFDYMLTCAFGQFLSDDVLSLPKIKPLNIHGSLLPEGRGGAPLHWSIINGKKKTGISIMEMVSKMDAGDYYSQYEINIENEDTVDILFEKMSKLILEKSAEGVIGVHNGKKATPQNEKKVSFWMNIKKEDAKINFNQDAQSVYNQIRGLTSKPGAWTTLGNKIVKINQSSLSEEEDVMKKPGRVIKTDDNGVHVSTQKGIIIFKELTISGGKKMTVTSKNNELFFDKMFK